MYVCVGSTHIHTCINAAVAVAVRSRSRSALPRNHEACRGHRRELGHWPGAVYLGSRSPCRVGSTVVPFCPFHCPGFLEKLAKNKQDTRVRIALLGYAAQLWKSLGRPYFVESRRLEMMGAWYIYIHIYVYIYIYACMFLYVCVCMHACMCVYIYAYTYIYIYVYMYILCLPVLFQVFWGGGQSHSNSAASTQESILRFQNVGHGLGFVTRPV